jgi:hypothetical protein
LLFIQTTNQSTLSHQREKEVKQVSKMNGEQKNKKMFIKKTDCLSIYTLKERKIILSIHPNQVQV